MPLLVMALFVIPVVNVVVPVVAEMQDCRQMSPATRRPMAAASCGRPSDFARRPKAISVTKRYKGKKVDLDNGWKNKPVL